MDIFKVTRDSVIINAPHVTLAGYPRSTTIRYAYSNSTNEYPPLYHSESTCPHWVAAILDDPDTTEIDESQGGYHKATAKETCINSTDWTTDQLEWQDGRYIWQWIQTVAYKYSKTNDTWEDEVTDTIVCQAGTSAASYWVIYSTKAHTGTQQTEDIVVTAMLKVGTSKECEDVDATIFYRWVGDTDFVESTTKHTLTIPAANVQAKNLEIVAKRNNQEYARDTIIFSPANSPVLYLNKETAFIAYREETLDRIGESVSSSAQLYLNGEVIPAEVFWLTSPTACTVLQTPTTKWFNQANPTGTVINNSTITVSTLYEDSVTVNCWAFEPLHPFEKIMHVTNLSESDWTTNGAVGVTKTWSSISVSPDKYFVVIGKSTDTESNHILWYQAISGTENETTGKCVAHKAFYEKDFTVAKQLQAVSIRSQTTYYALIAPTIAAGWIKNPTGDADLEIKAYESYNSTTGIGTGERNLNEGDQTIKNNWELQPPAHTLATIDAGWKYWTTVRTEKTDNTVSYSTPIIDESVSGAYALAQGKSKNYYQDTDPAGDPTQPTYGQNIGPGDYWFDTSARYVKVTPTTDPAVNTVSGKENTFSTKEQYIGYFIKKTSAGTKHDNELSDDDMTEITKDNCEDVINFGEDGAEPGPIAYKLDQNVLKQWDSTNKIWTDVGGEIVHNKVTTNYINALDITAKKVTVIDSTDSGILFDANGLGYDTSGKKVDPYVKIAGFTVEKNTLTTGEAESGNLIKLSSENEGNGNQYKIEALSSAEVANLSEEYTSDMPPTTLQRAQNLWIPTGDANNENNDLPHIGYYINNTALRGGPGYGAIKITFTEDISDFTLYLKGLVVDSTNDYLIASTKNIDLSNSTIPTAYNAANVKGHTYEQTTPVAVNYGDVSVNDYIYIIYQFASGNLVSGNINYGGYVYLPTNVRMTIGKKFHILADGTAYASNLFLGGTKFEDLSGSGDSDAPIASDVTSAGDILGQLQADTIQAKKIEVNNTDGDIIFKADGRALDENGNTINDIDRVKIGGFTVTANSISSGNKDTSEDLEAIAAKSGVYIGPAGISIGKGFTVYAGEEGKATVANVELTKEQEAAFTPTVYWISSTCTVHTGTKHGQNIVVTAMKKVGGAAESQDSEDLQTGYSGAYLWWRYKNATKDDGEPSD